MRSQRSFPIEDSVLIILTANPGQFGPMQSDVLQDEMEYTPFKFRLKGPLSLSDGGNASSSSLRKEH